MFEDPGENPGDPPVQNTEKKIHFVIVGPFTDEAKITTGKCDGQYYSSEAEYYSKLNTITSEYLRLY